MKRRGIVWGMSVILTAGSLFYHFPAQVSQAEENVSVVSGGAVVEQPLPEIGTVTIFSVKKEKSLKKVTLTWSPVNDVQGYYVMRKTGSGFYQMVASVTQTGFEDLTVQAGNTYTYQVVAFQTLASGEVRTGTCAGEKTISLVPGKVKGLKVKKSRGKFIVTWKKTSGATGYQVYTKVFVKGIKTKYNKAKTLKSRKYKRGMLVRKMKYGFKVRAYKKVNGKNIYGPFTTVTKRYK